MAAISRQIGSVSVYLPVFIPNATVSTGAGLANISSTNVSISWARNNMAAVSTYTGSTGTLGTWAVSTMNQYSSSLALGWYGVSVPDAVFTSGDSAILHLYGATSMAPVPVLIELTKTNNQQYTSSTVFSSTNAVSTISGSVGVSSIGMAVSVSSAVGVSSFAITVGVSSFNLPVGVSSFTLPVGVSSFAIAVGVSSIATPVTVSSGVVSVSSYTIPAGVSSISTPVSVSSMTIPVGVSSFALAVGVSSFALAVGVSSFTLPVGVSSFTLPVGVSSFAIDVGVSSLTATATGSIADKYLGRNVSSGGDGGRTVSEALYVLRNKVDALAGVVYKTDDTTSSWSFSVSTVAGNPIQVITPN